MADKTIGSLPQSPVLTDDSSFVCEDSGVAKRVTGKQFKDFAKEGAVLAVEAAESAADRAEAAAAEATQIVTHTPYIGENGNWFVWDNFKKNYVDSTIDASITVQIADVTMLPFGSNPYITNTGTDTDPVFHLFIPSAKNGNDGHTPVKGVDYFDGKTPVKGVDYNDGADGFSPIVSVSQISGGHKVTVTDKDGSNDFNVMDGDTITDIRQTGGTGAAGTVDTYTITTSSGATYLFYVRNGADGRGAGDMIKAVYDPTNKAQDIFAYADGLAAAAKAKLFSVTIPASGWSGNAQTVSNDMLKAAGFGYIYNPDEASYGAYVSAMVRCGEVTVDGQVTFYCDDTPTDDITVDFIRIEVNDDV